MIYNEKLRNIRMAEFDIQRRSKDEIYRGKVGDGLIISTTRLEGEDYDSWHSRHIKECQKAKEMVE